MGKARGLFIKKEQGKKPAKFRKVGKACSLVQGWHGDNEVRCPVKPKERSTSLLD